MLAQTGLLPLAAAAVDVVAHPSGSNRDFHHSWSHSEGVVESASLGQWRHVEGRGDGAAVSALVVDGMNLVALPAR